VSRAERRREREVAMLWRHGRRDGWTSVAQRVAATSAAVVLMVFIRSWIVAIWGSWRRLAKRGERRAVGRRGFPHMGAARHHGPGVRASGAIVVMWGRDRIPRTRRRRGSCVGVGSMGGWSAVGQMMARGEILG
jgi:hypothetical protein